MNMDNLAITLKEKQAFLVGSNMCMHCLREEKPAVIYYILLDITLGEIDYKRIAMFLCKDCKTKNNPEKINNNLYYILTEFDFKVI